MCICRVSLVDFYRRIRIGRPTFTTAVPYRKVIYQTGCWRGLFLVDVMYVCETCFRPCNSMSVIFNAPQCAEYAISRHQIHFWGSGMHSPFPRPMGRGTLSPTAPPAAPTAPRSSCRRHLPPANICEYANTSRFIFHKRPKSAS